MSPPLPGACTLEGLSLAKAETLPVLFMLELGGSEALALVPLGADTHVSMRADLAASLLPGPLLPAKHEISAEASPRAGKVRRFARKARKDEQIAVSLSSPSGL